MINLDFTFKYSDGIKFYSFRSTKNLSNFSSTGSMWAMIRLTFEKLENFSCIFFPFKSVKYSGRLSNCSKWLLAKGLIHDLKEKMSPGYVRLAAK